MDQKTGSHTAEGDEWAALRKRVADLETDVARWRQKAEESQRSCHAFRILLDSIPQRVFWKDRDSTFLGCNRLFAQDASLDDPSTIVGKNDFDFQWRDVAQLYRADDAAVMESDMPKLGFEEPQTRADGSRYWLKTSKVPLHDDAGTVIGVLGLYEDITTLKETEQVTIHERNLLRTLIDNLPDLIYFKDDHGRYILNNRAHLRSIGLESQIDVLGHSSYDFHPIDFANQYHEDEIEIIRSGEALLDREERALHQDTGEERWHLTSKVPLVDESGKVTGFVGISRDITEQRKAKAEREEMIRQLQEAAADVKTLSGLVPICANCKKIRDDKGFWTQIEAYIQDRTPAHFSHGICPESAKKLYPDYHPRKKPLQR